MKAEISTGTGIAIAGLLLASATVAVDRYEIVSVGAAIYLKTDRLTGTLHVCELVTVGPSFMGGDVRLDLNEMKITCGPRSD